MEHHRFGDHHYGDKRIPSATPDEGFWAKQTGPIIFWWETEPGKTISETTMRIMHAAVKSAFLHFEDPTVLIFSNSLPRDAFCESGSSLVGWERERALPWTCRAEVRRYSLHQLLEAHPSVGKGIENIIDDLDEDDPNGSAHLLSDILRYLLLFEHGGTYMDIDQIFIRPLPALAPLMSAQVIWRDSECDTKRHPRPWFCNLQGSVSGKKVGFQNGTRIFLYSGLLAGFEKHDAFMQRAIEMIPGEYTSKCWGCVGPQLVTKAFADFSRQKEGHDVESDVADLAAAHILPSDHLLMVKPRWFAAEFTREEWLKSEGAILDVDFHSEKLSNAITPGILSRTLFADKKPGKKHASLDDLVDEEQFQLLTKAASGKSKLMKSDDFPTLPWINKFNSEVESISPEGTRSSTGCTCFFDQSRADCACCHTGFCQCDEHSDHHQCAKCGEEKACSIFANIKARGVPGLPPPHVLPQANRPPEDEDDI